MYVCKCVCEGTCVFLYTFTHVHLKSYICKYVYKYGWIVCKLFSMYHRNIKFIFIFTFCFILFYFIFFFVCFFSLFHFLIFYLFFFFSFFFCLPFVYETHLCEQKFLGFSFGCYWGRRGLGWIGLGWYHFSSSASHIYILSLIM